MRTGAVRHSFASSRATSVALGVAIAVSLGAPAFSETTPWATNEGGRMRLVALPPASDGTIRGALQIEPNPGWMTYWREPGDAGIPPQLTFPEEAAVQLKKMEYPVPKRIDSGDLRDIGYDHPVTLPFELKVEDISKPVKVGVSAFVGLCRNICIPFQADFALELADTGPSMEEAMLLASAETRLPEPASDDFKVIHHALSDEDLLKLQLRLPAETAGAPQVIVTGPEGHAFFDSGKGEVTGRDYSLDIPIDKLPHGYDVKGKTWGVLVIAGDRAMESSLVFN
ncbi:cytochrome C biogenesis protein [Pseudorhizobium halotolerans]|uniref:Cytochrome C biogenesis protein n=2 Tax=Pseudorhizobium halotolerans TaxID=1233081 RepID=A0ABM8PZT4_9HYPH|nr:cytochrome C biogenesis protein [Pseudorhizobium halotolerans]